jgi:hypothetical protein
MFSIGQERPKINGELSIKPHKFMRFADTLLHQARFVRVQF